MLNALTNLPDPSQLEAMAALLGSSGQFRVLRRITPRLPRDVLPGMPTRFGLLLDLETTGLDPTEDEIIEMAMLPFTYELDGTV